MIHVLKMVGILIADVPSMLSFFVGIRPRLVTHLCREKSPFLIPNWTEKNTCYMVYPYISCSKPIWCYIPLFILLFHGLSLYSLYIVSVPLKILCPICKQPTSTEH